MRLLAVNYHYYRERAPAAGIHPITPERFATQVSLLARHWKLTTQTDLLDYLSQGTQSEAQPEGNYCLITFDDGLKEQMQAVRWLMAHNLRAVCFVPTAPLTERKVLDVHKLHLIRSLKSDAALATDLAALFPTYADLDPEAATQQYPYDSDLARRIKFFLNFLLPPDARHAWIGGMFSELAGDEAAAALQLYMDRDDLVELARHDMLGAHGHSHRPLAALDGEQIHAEIGECLAVLSDVTGTRVKGISYPYGGPSAVSADVAGIAAKLELSYGFTMQGGINAQDDFARPMLLKRIDTNDVPNFMRVERPAT